jgi:hypothetical protein
LESKYGQYFKEYFGDSLIVSISKTGDFQMAFPNSGIHNGLDSILFYGEEGQVTMVHSSFQSDSDHSSTISRDIELCNSTNIPESNYCSCRCTGKYNSGKDGDITFFGSVESLALNPILFSKYTNSGLAQFINECGVFYSKRVDRSIVEGLSVTFSYISIVD